MKKIVLANCILLLMLPVMAQEMQFYNQSAQVIIYEHSNFSGTSKSFGVGTYRFTTPADFNDIVSSIKVPAGLVAVIYEHANEKGGYGNYIDLMEDCADLSIYNFNDKVSYLSVFNASKPGYIYMRNRTIKNQFVAGHWERLRANSPLPNNSPPAVSSSLPETVVPVKKVVDEKIPIYRIELRIVTGKQANEDEDQEVYVKMNDIDKEYFLDYGPDDFELGSDRRYDIISASIRTLADIKHLTIGVKGDDMWGIEKVELYLNNSPTPVFYKTYRGSYRLNGEGDYPRTAFYSGDEIRSNVYWKAIPDNAALTKPPVPIPFAMIKSMVESMVGNQMHHLTDKKLFWGNTSGYNTVWGDHVEANRLDGNTLHFDLDLEYEATGSNPEVDVDFDIRFDCNPNGWVDIKTENIKIGCQVLGAVSCESIISVINVFITRFGYDPLNGPGSEEKLFSKVFSLNSPGSKCKGVLVNPDLSVFIY